jgi:hypothetical protein
MAPRSVRLRGGLNRYFLPVAAILVILAVLGGWIAFTTHVAPGTTTDQRPGASWETTGWFNYSANATEANPIYPVGTTLTNRSVYFAGVSPWLNGTYTFAYDASRSGNLTGTVVLRMTFRSVEEDAERTIVWEKRQRLSSPVRQSLAPGESLSIPFAINVNRTLNRTEIIDDRLENPPGQPQLLVNASLAVEGTVNGRSLQRVRTHSLPVELERNTYRPDYPGVFTERGQRTRTVTVERTYGPLRRLGAPLVSVAALTALAGLAVARRRGALALSDAERERLAYEDDRSDFDEWISPIDLPDEAFGLPEARAASLGALVDFAIDTDNGVVEVPDEERYHVVHDGYLYTYEPPTPDDAGDTAETETDAESPDPASSEGTDPLDPDAQGTDD